MVAYVSICTLFSFTQSWGASSTPTSSGVVVCFSLAVFTGGDWVLCGESTSCSVYWVDELNPQILKRISVIVGVFILMCVCIVSFGTFLIWI